jgi:hypothetical protein
MNRTARDNEDIIQKLENINGLIDTTLFRIDRIYKLCLSNEPIIKEKLLDDLTVISNNLSESMKKCVTIFKNYFAIPCSTKNDYIPNYLTTEKKIDVINTDLAIIEKYKIEDNQLYDNEKRYKDNCNKLCKKFSEKLREYNKKNKKKYISKDEINSIKNEREANINNLKTILNDYYKKI